MLRRHARKRRKGAQLLEFALILPIFLFLILFSLDMGRMVFYSGLIHDAVYTSARAGAQVGGAGTNSAGASRTAFFDAITLLPNVETSAQAEKSGRFEVLRGAKCAKGATSPDRFVEVRGSYAVDFITPGLQTLLTIGGMGDRVDDEGAWRLPATGIARCEVVRE